MRVRAVQVQAVKNVRGEQPHYTKRSLSVIPFARIAY